METRSEGGTRNGGGFVVFASAASLFLAGLAGPSPGQVTSRVSVGSAGGQGNNASASAFISADGRYVAFGSSATNLVAGDTNASDDVFVRDRVLGTTERVSVDSGGVQGENYSYVSGISADARYVVFSSYSTNFVAGDTNGKNDVFVRDRQLGTTERVSVDSGWAQGNGDSYGARISDDGRYVAFYSLASNLVVGDTNGSIDVFVRDRQLGVTERVSVDSGGTQGNGDSRFPSISGDGRCVAFHSDATNLVVGDTNLNPDVFVRDRQLGTTERVSVDSGGVQANSFSQNPSISGDGRCVAFRSFAMNLVGGDTNGSYDVFVRDRQLGTTERVSVNTGGSQGNADSTFASISADGRSVAFESFATNLVAGDTDSTADVFVRDRLLGTTERASVDSNGTEANGYCYTPSISADGRFVAFESLATHLVAGDTNATWDVFVHDRAYAPFQNLCDPGASGVVGCPCSNPPSGSARGCDNSASTGGAALAASGIAYLSQDSLVFTTSGEKPTATSVLLQGTTPIGSGAGYGQGVRCAGGTLKRLFTKTASGGSITAPDFGAGDPTVSVRSAQKGNPIGGGQSRWYLVFYRDPVVLGGCPSTSTFNATQTLRTDWTP